MAGIIELTDADAALDLVFIGDSQSLFGLGLNGQTVAVPAPDTGNGITAHSPVTCDHILDEGNQHSTVVRLTGGERRAVVENDFIFFVLMHRTLEYIVFTPEAEHILLDLRQIGLTGNGLIFHSGDTSFL